MKTKISAVAFYLVAAFFTNALAKDLVIPLEGRATSLAVLGSGQFLADQTTGITRFNEDGTIDATLTLLGSMSKLAVENDGMVLAQTGSTVKRFDMDAAQQTEVTNAIRSFVLQPDGKLVAMIFNSPGAELPFSLSRLNPDGTTDSSFTTTLFGSSRSSVLALQEDGKIIVAADSNGAITRFNRDGSRDLTFNPPLITPSFVNVMIVQADGKIIVGGSFNCAGSETRFGLLRLNPDGTLDAAFNPASEIVGSMDYFALQANGKILLSGNFRSIAGKAATNIARLNPDGTLDSSFAPKLSIPISGFSAPLVLLDDGSVLAGLGTNLVRITNPDPATQTLTRDGSTITWLRGGSSPELFHARFQASLDGINWTDLGSAERINGGWRLQNASIPASARLRGRGYVSGTSHYIDYITGAPIFYSQPMDRTVNTGTNVEFRVSAKGLEPVTIQWLKDGQPLAGANSPILLLTNVTGAFAGSYSAIVSNSEGSITSRIAQLIVIDPFIVTQPNSIWINVGGSTNLSVTAAGVGLSYQWKRDGQNIPGATSSALQFSGMTPADTGKYQVIIKGTYGTVESSIVTVRVNTALPDPNFKPNWEATGQWFPIQTAVAHNDELYIGGSFRMLDAQGQQHLIKVKSDGSVDPLFAPLLTGGEGEGVTALCIAPNGQLLVGGSFWNVNGRFQAYLARLNADGTPDLQFHPSISGVGNGRYTQVTSIEILPDGRILIGGNFTMVGGQPRFGLALLLPDGRLDKSFDPSDPPRLTWGTIVQPSGKIIAYGWDYRRFLPDGTADFDFAEAVAASSFYLLPLANGKMFINSQQGVAPIFTTLIDSDGTPDLSSKVSFHSGVEVEQANGEIVVRHEGEIIPIDIAHGGTTFKQYHSLLRMSLDGTEDPAFSPLFDNNAFYEAMRGDGTMLIAGRFTNVAGIKLPKLALLRNTEPATQILTVNGTKATWMRNATSPEVTRAIFEFSTDGVTWTNLGAGVRIPGGWQLDGLQLSSSGKLRARGFFQGSIYDTTIDLSTGIKLGIPNRQLQNSELVLNATAPNSTRVILQMSTDLRNWTSIQTNRMTSQQMQLTLTNQTAPHAFYRLLQAND